ncbi:TonB-dependent receptor [Rubricoccus marinus]|uniref:TonB-dependent receptor n=1 Tax=Rubricoccus marinus TaxID=716817 RepID=A0A259U2S9_9BACT|nr:TonB-dependent receptor [Rubricoccus marinus]OZC04309.1 hypothetical protein BSZ36_15765 [Rubricoccus marinus]
MLRFFLAAALVGLAAGAHAQTLSGRVTDAQTGEALPGATVFLPQLASGAATDADGRYTVALPGAGVYRVVVSFVGYTSRTEAVTVASGGTVYDVALQDSAVEAPVITVTARSGASDILTTPQSVAVITARELQREATGSPMDALEDVAGVRLLRTGPAVAKPVVRGLTAQRVLIVNDGVRQEGQGWGDEHGPEIGGADVDGIEVVRGPASLLYGSDALGGVIQTVQDDLFDLGAFGATAQVTGVSMAQSAAGQLRAGASGADWGAEARVGGLRAGQVRTPQALIPNTAQEQFTLSARAGRRFARGEVVAELGRFEQQLGLFEPEEADELGDLSRFEIGAPFQRVSHDRAVLRGETRLASGDRIEIIGAAQQNRRLEFEEADEAELSLRLTTGTLDARLHHRPIGRVFGTIGVSGMAQTNETLAEETLIPGGQTLNGAVYVAEQLILSRVTLDAGLRFDARSLDVDSAPDLGVEAQTRSYTALTGAIGAAYQPRTDLSFAANLGRAFRAPVLQELFGNGVHEGTLRFERGNADLTPEASLALDGTVRYFTPHVYLEAAAFVNRIDGYIYPLASGEIDDESGFEIFDFTQAQARLYGAEVRLDIHPHVLHGLGVHLQGDLTRSDNLDTDVPLPFVPPARLETVVEYSAERIGPARDVEVRFGPTFTASQTRPELPSEIPTDAYTTWDASLSAAFQASGATITPVLALDNLTDAAYVDPLSRYRPYGILSPGRSVRVSLRVAF